jgi:hypothetical protein
LMVLRFGQEIHFLLKRNFNIIIVIKKFREIKLLHDFLMFFVAIYCITKHLIQCLETKLLSSAAEIINKCILFNVFNVDSFLTYLLRSRKTVCFVDPRPPNGGRGATKHTAFPRCQ